MILNTKVYIRTHIILDQFLKFLVSRLDCTSECSCFVKSSEISVFLFGLGV